MSTEHSASGPVRGLRIRVRGQVQGVGFRPFIWQLARRHGVTGSVLNDPGGVLITAHGASDAFLAAIRTDAPTLAKVDAVEPEDMVFDTAPVGFLIAASDGVGAQTRVTPDAATCPACLAEIRDPSDRRAGYAFANCTHCGPRFSILDRLPYDRAQTSMAAFALCADCACEYSDPGDRRFHAQPVACAVCGPRLWAEDVSGARIEGDAIAIAADWLSDGKVIAIKGIGGFHLACDATNADAVATLRQRKGRPTKPLALMAPPGIIAQHGDPSPSESALLADPAAPIVLLESARARLPDGVAPGQDHLGWMLPHTPLHHLLLDAVRRPLVMTSGNLSGDPQVITNAEARAALARFADGFILHDRDIRRRLDDSVERITPQGPMILRRGRGRVPGTLPVPPGFEDGPDVLALGGQMKGAICLTKTGQALVSHHLGDLDGRLNVEEFRKAVRDYTALFDHAPGCIAVDLHPGYRATRFGKAMAAETGLPLVPVQHHHAHLAACLGENLWPRDAGPVAGIVLDGLGFGPDGKIWGGEVLVGDYHGFDRLAWIEPAALIGGDAAGRDPWRNHLARLDLAGMQAEADRRYPDAPRDVMRRAVAQGVNAPLSSSAGRLFDAVAAALGVAPLRQTHEAEAAMALEALARADTSGGIDAAYELPLNDGALCTAPLFRALAATSEPPARKAARFHATLAAAFAAIAQGEIRAGRARAVALTGGCFQNALLLDVTCRALGDAPVLLHHMLPANDGGLAFGQALIAAAKPGG